MQAAKEKLVVICADGNRFTSIVLAQWLLKDYIGSDNALEACDALPARYRHTGVKRSVEEAELEQLLSEDKLASRLLM